MSRDYVLVKEYPGVLGSLGTIARKEQDGYYYFETKNNGRMRVQTSYIKKHPDYWKRVLFYCDSGNPICYNDDVYFIEDNKIFKLDWENAHWKKLVENYTMYSSFVEAKTKLIEQMGEKLTEIKNERRKSIILNVEENTSEVIETTFNNAFNYLALEKLEKISFVNSVMEKVVNNLLNNN